MQIVRTLPPGSVFTILDSTGVVLWRSVDADHWIGRRYAGIAGVEHHNRVLDGAGLVKSDDGTSRLVSWRRVNSTGWTVYVGIPAQYTLDLAQAQFVRDLGSGMVVTLLALFLAYLGTRRLVAPIESLTVDAVAIADGDEARRSQITSRDEIGALARAFNQMADTAATRRRALGDSERRYRVLFDSNPLPVLAWSTRTGCLTDANDAALAQFGYTREAFLGRPMFDLVMPDEYERINAIIARSATFRSGQTVSGMRRMRRADGTPIDIEVHAAVVVRDAETEMVVVAIDVGARNAAARALEESREQLRQSQKMEALGSFAGGIAHDFNNYLSSIIGFAELAESDLPEASEALSDLHEIVQAASRAAALTRQILVFSRKQVIAPELLDPSEVVRSLERMLRTMLGESIAFTITGALRADLVHTDRGQLEQILVNLTRNARDAMPNGGSYSISVEHVIANSSTPWHQGVPAGEWVMLCARDTGQGIPETLLPRIFEPFFTTKERGSGTGLGLALVYSIMQQAHGHLRVESHPETGTAFFLYFPRSEAAAGSAPSTRSDAPSRGGTEHILVVEDDASVRLIACQMLERAGYHVESRPDGPSSLALLADPANPFALLLTDVVMPGMTGPALARVARQQRPDLRLLFMSGYPDDDSLVHGSSVGENAVAFIAKPFASESLLRRVRETLDATELSAL
jgi:PAS domain S-box-containing protein